MRRSLTLACVAALAACAEGPGDVNRVQPNAYAKAQFAGDWYYKQTVIDVPYENSMLFEGLPSALEKVRFELQEGALIAYRKVPHVIGASDSPDDPEPEFQPVAAWRITSHFDIVREYNPATGEQTNVISENTFDREWWERDYVRVDWTRNLIANTSSLDFALPFAFTNLSGADYWVQPVETEAANPDRFEMTADYIGLVNKFNVVPDTFACVLFFNDWWDGSSEACAPTTVKMRTSFVKVKPNERAYEPLAFPDRTGVEVDVNGDGEITADERIDRSLTICAKVENGACTEVTEVECTPEVLAKLRDDPLHGGAFGFTSADCDPTEERMFERFGYFRTQRLSYDRQNGHTETGRVNLANRWNLWERSFDDAGRPIPVAERKPKAIVYYLNPDFPLDLYPAAETIERQFDDAFRQTVASAQGKPLAEVPQLFDVRANSCSPALVKDYVKKGGHEAIVARVIGSLDKLSFDNLEEVCAALEWHTGFTWQKNGDLRHSFIYWVDRPQLAGPLGFGPSFADPETGELINGTAYVYGAGVDRQAAIATEIVQLLRGELTRDDVISGDSVRGLVRQNLARAQAMSEQAFSEGFYDSLAARLTALDRAPEGRLKEIPPQHFQERLNRIRGTPAERELLVNEEMLLNFVQGYRPGQAPSDAMIAQASPAVAFSAEAKKRRDDRIYHLTHKHCVMTEDFVDTSVIGLAMEYDGAGKTRDEIYADLREQVFLGVMLHEVGHTIGLRHNFSGSNDALNYYDNFWKYRSLPQGLAAARDATDDDRLAIRLQGCIDRAAEWGVPEPDTISCLRGSELKTSSIMDYGARFNAHFQGLGRYDKAAIKFGYGQLVEQFDEGVGLPDNLETELFWGDYRQLPQLVGGVANLAARNDVPFSEVVKARFDRIAAATAAVPTFTEDQNGNFSCVENCDHRIGAVREVPYKFCSDEYAGFDNFECKLWDEGANMEEVIDSAIEQYRNYYPFWAYKRDRFAWDPSGYYNTLASRVFSRFTTAFRYYFYLGGPDNLESFFSRSLARASVKGLNLLAETLQTPLPGRYCLRDRGTPDDPTDDAYFRCSPQEETTSALVIPEGLGKFNGSGFSDEYTFGITRASGFIEKLIALQALTDNLAFFLRVDSFDTRAFSIGYYRLFKDEMLSLFGSIITADRSGFAGYVVDGPGGEKVYAPRLVVNPDGSTVSATRPGPIVWTYLDPYIPLYTYLYGLVGFTSTLDWKLDFKNYFKIALKGSPDDIDFGNVDITDPSQYVEFTDPVSRYTYRAVNTTDGNGYGHRILTQIKDVYEQGWVPAKAALDATAPGTEEHRLAKQQFDAWDTELNYRVEQVREMRMLHQVFGD